MKSSRYATMTPSDIRRLCRENRFVGPTAGVACGFAQANLVVLPSELAPDFSQFCARNPKPCPLLEVTPKGQYEPVQTAPQADLRTDLPRYRVFHRGRCTEKPLSIESYWTPDLVAFLIGCSFSFDEILLAAGLPVRHVEQNTNVPMYKTSIPCRPAGRFAAPLVVSMRPMTPHQAKEAEKLTTGRPTMHGAPIEIGHQTQLGITHLDRPDYGDPVEIRSNEIPVFWACGVTPLEAVKHAQPDLAITHDPGHMFLTDLPVPMQ